jgi:hypothetical protein
MAMSLKSVLPRLFDSLLQASSAQKPKATVIQQKMLRAPGTLEDCRMPKLVASLQDTGD